MDLIQGHHVAKIEVEHYDTYLDQKRVLVGSYDFNEHEQRYEVTLHTNDLTTLSKSSARELRDFLNGLNLEGRG